MSYMIRPLQREDDKRWAMTALDVGPETTENGISVAEVGTLFAADHDHASEIDCYRCDRCSTWARKYRVG